MSFNKKYSPVFHFFFLLFFIIHLNVSYAEKVDTSLARKYLNNAVNCFNNSKVDSSLFYYRLATDRYIKEKNWLFYTYCLIGSGKLYLRRGNIEKSNNYFDMAEKTAHSFVYYDPDTKDADKIYLKYSLAYTVGQYDKVIQHGEQYLQYNSTKYDVCYIHYTLGYCYYYLQDYENSNKAYFNALKTFEGNNNGISLLSNTYSAIATNYYLQSEYDNAILYYNKAINIFENNYKTHPEFARTLTSLSILYYAQGNYKKAIFCLQYALKIGNDKSLNSCIFRSLGSCYEKLDDFAQAEKNYLKALEYTKTDVNNKAEKITILLFYADLCKRNNNREKALSLYNQALMLSLKNLGLKNSLTSKCHTFLADFYISEKNYKKAFQNYQFALISLNPQFYSTDIYTNPSMGKIFSYSQYFKVLKNKADALREYYKTTKLQKDLKMSLETYELLCHEMENQRAGFITKEDKAFITEKYYSIYSSALQTTMQLYGITHNENYKERALKLAEQNKSAFLLEKFNENNAKNFAGVPSHIREKERTLKHCIANCEKMIYEESLKKTGNPKTISYWESCLFNSRNANDTLSVYIKNNYMGYHRLKYNPSGISSAEIQKKLSPESALIEYALADTVLYIFLITKETFKITTQIPLTEHEKEKFNQCFNISKINLCANLYFRNYTQAAYCLYEKLIKPVESFIEHKEELIIIPDEKLALIPFEVLISSEKISDVNYKHLPYLIKKFNIGYVQLATLLVKPNSCISDNPLLLAIAPDYGSSIFLAQPEIRKLISEGYDMDTIPGVIEEVKYLGQTVGSKILFSDKATEGAFKKLQRRFTILHLAMHTIVDNNPMYSKFIFSKSEVAGEDGFLNLYELMNMEIGAKLIVLSGCNTGTGNFLKGEGIMNLARGFFYAGSQSVIMTLWAINDKESNELIKNFYKYFITGKSKTEALRLAKLNYLEHAKNIKAHPFYWAGYVNIGDASPLYPNHKIKITLYILGLFLLIFSVIIIVKLKKRKRKKTMNLFTPIP